MRPRQLPPPNPIIRAAWAELRKGERTKAEPAAPAKKAPAKKTKTAKKGTR